MDLKTIINNFEELKKANVFTKAQLLWDEIELITNPLEYNMIYNVVTTSIKLQSDAKTYNLRMLKIGENMFPPRTVQLKYPIEDLDFFIEELNEMKKYLETNVYPKIKDVVVIYEP